MNASPVARSAALSAFLLLALAACASTRADRPVTRIDATSVETANASFNAMISEASKRKRERLLVAMLEINFASVQSAYEIVGNPELQEPSIARIRDRVAGMTADEIIAYAAEVSAVETEVQRR